MFSPNSCAQFKQNLWESKPRPVYIPVAFAQVSLASRFFHTFFKKTAPLCQLFDRVEQRGPSPVRLGPQFCGNWLKEKMMTVSSPAGAAQIWTCGGHIHGKG